MKQPIQFKGFLAICLLAACSASSGGGGNTPTDGGSTPTCGRAGRAGTTSCVGGTITCSAGQYCNMPMLTCTAGCTSDENCSAMEYCMRASGEAVGACARCASNPTPDGGMSGGSCQASLDMLLTCMAINNAQYAAALAACSMAPAATVAALNNCVNGARGDCAMMRNCVPGSGDGGVTPPPDGGGGGCTADSMCNTSPGIQHEICSGGFCRPGCRLNSDCGADFSCDDASHLCFPD